MHTCTSVEKNLRLYSSGFPFFAVRIQKFQGESTTFLYNRKDASITSIKRRWWKVSQGYFSGLTVHITVAIIEIIISPAPAPLLHLLGIVIVVHCKEAKEIAGDGKGNWLYKKRSIPTLFSPSFVQRPEAKKEAHLKSQNQTVGEPARSRARRNSLKGYSTTSVSLRRCVGT